MLELEFSHWCQKVTSRVQERRDVLDGLAVMRNHQRLCDRDTAELKQELSKLR